MAGSGHKIDAFVGRYHHEFVPRYGVANHTLAAGWNSSNSLFATFYGINDVRSCTDQPLMKDDCGSYFKSLFTIYGFLLEQVNSFPYPSFSNLENHQTYLFVQTAIHQRRPQLPHPQHPPSRPHALLPPMGPPRPSTRCLNLEHRSRCTRVQLQPQAP